MHLFAKFSNYPASSLDMFNHYVFSNQLNYSIPSTTFSQNELLLNGKVSNEIEWDSMYLMSIND